MVTRVEPHQRQRFYRLHLGGETYAQIAERFAVSKECVRYWCRRQRDGGSPYTQYGHRPPGLLGSFDPLVRYVILRLRLHHPRWGPNRILAHLRWRLSLRPLALPSEASIGRYLHQWPRFRRHRKQTKNAQRPSQPTSVQQRWQLDFKLGIALQDRTLVNLHTVRDPVGEVCVGATVFPAGRVGHYPQRATLAQVQATLRRCFARWNTLPREVQTDSEAVFIGQPQDTFPSGLILWLQGLGIQHLVIRPGKPTDNAEVERCQRTLHDYAIVGNEGCALPELQEVLDQAMHDLAFTLPSRAEGCQGRPPVEAHPELLQPQRFFRADLELALFDLRKVDAYLATFVWERKVGKTGQVRLGSGNHRYSLGRAQAGKQVQIRFDPADRHFVFYTGQPPEEIGRRPAKGLDIADLTGIIALPSGPVPQQIPLPFPLLKGVNC